MPKKKSDPESKPKKESLKKAAGKTRKAVAAKAADPIADPAALPKPEPEAAPSKPKAAKEAKPAPKKPAIVISNDDISLRAYFIAERRQKLGWPGDSTGDWVEAERQLRAEAKKKKP